jgi:hypothetical protein
MPVTSTAIVGNFRGRELCWHGMGLEGMFSSLGYRSRMVGDMPRPRCSSLVATALTEMDPPELRGRRAPAL